MVQEIALLRGSGYLREGWQRIRQPGLRRFVVIPLAVNLLLFAALVSWGIRQFNYWMDRLMPHLPEWAGFVEWLLWPLFALVVLLVLFFGFSIVANLIASPFYGFLAEKIAEQERGLGSPATGWHEILMMVPRSLGRELRKIVYYLPRLTGLLLLTLIPVVNLLASPLLLLFGVWMMAVQYIDYQGTTSRSAFPTCCAGC